MIVISFLYVYLCKQNIKTKKMEIQIGQHYLNRKGEIHRIINVSPKGNLLTAKNVDTNINSIFRYYVASGLYIKSGTASVEIGIFVK